MDADDDNTVVLHSRLQKPLTCVRQASPGSPFDFEDEQMMMIMKMLWVVVVVVVVMRQQVKLQKLLACVDQPKPWCQTGSSRAW